MKIKCIKSYTVPNYENGVRVGDITIEKGLILTEMKSYKFSFENTGYAIFDVVDNNSYEKRFVTITAYLMATHYIEID